MEEEICGTIECSGGWACGQHLQPQILGVMMASELKDHFGWGFQSQKIPRKRLHPLSFSYFTQYFMNKTYYALENDFIFFFIYYRFREKKQKCFIFEFPCLQGYVNTLLYLLMLCCQIDSTHVCTFLSLYAPDAFFFLGNNLHNKNNFSKC